MIEEIQKKIREAKAANKPKLVIQKLQQQLDRLCNDKNNKKRNNK